jgi:hypothetical protein
VRAGRARSWWFAIALIAAALVLLIFLLAVPGCGSGSTGLGGR